MTQLAFYLVETGSFKTPEEALTAIQKAAAKGLRIKDCIGGSIHQAWVKASFGFSPDTRLSDLPA